MNLTDAISLLVKIFVDTTRGGEMRNSTYRRNFIPKDEIVSAN